jgi:hypothetical protein
VGKRKIPKRGTIITQGVEEEEDEDDIEETKNEENVSTIL